MEVAKPLRRSMALVEFLACRETVEAMLAQGFSKRLIHERLTADSRISMAYITFCQIMQKAAKNELHVASLRPVISDDGKQKPKPVSPSVPNPGSSPRFVAATANKFPDPREMDLNDAL